MMRVLLILLLCPLISAAQYECDSMHNYIDYQSIHYRFYDAAGQVTSGLTTLYSHDSITAFLQSPVDSLDWTNSWRNDNGYGPFTSLKSFTFGSKDKGTGKDSSLTIFHSSTGGFGLFEIGFSHDSTLFIIDSVEFTNQTSIEEIKNRYYCSWSLYELERDSGLVHLRKHDSEQLYIPVRFHLLADVHKVTSGYDRITFLCAQHLIMFFKNDKLIRIQIYTGS